MSVYLDTSALAKLYVNEPGSDELAAYVESVERPTISTLVVTEMQSLLGRHLRLGNVDGGYVGDAMDLLLADVDEGRLQQRRVRDAHVRLARYVMTRLDGVALRTLDALHLAVCESHGFERLATADRRMVEGATAMGMAVDTF